MIKAILILVILLGILSYILVVMTATPSDKKDYEASMRWKEERKKNERSD